MVVNIVFNVASSLEIFCRLETLVDQWETFEREASAFEQWLTLSNQQLTRISAMDNLDLQNISAIKCKIDNFLVRLSMISNQPLHV